MKNNLHFYKNLRISENKQDGMTYLLFWLFRHLSRQRLKPKKYYLKRKRKKQNLNPIPTPAQAARFCLGQMGLNRRGR